MHGDIAESKRLSREDFVCEYKNPVRPNSEFSSDQCRHCWIKLNSEKVHYKTALELPVLKRSPCSKLGKVVEKANCSCPRKDKRVCKAGYGVVSQEANCDGKNCPDYEVDGDFETCGVVLGAYGLNKLAHLQVRQINQTCGQIPILISDDGSNEDFSESIGESKLVEFWPNADRLGHYGGDLSVFWKGFQWAINRKIRWLCKLSQRFIWTEGNWLQSAIARLEDSGEATMMQRCIDNNVNLYIRSECVLFDMKQWEKHYNTLAKEQLGQPTELFVWDLVHRFFGEKFCVWDQLPVNRYARAPGTIWHGSHSPSDFQELAMSHKIDLGPNFTCAGWESLPGWKRG